LKERDLLAKKIEDVDNTRKIKVETFPSPIQAFVTFDTEEGYMTACKCYTLSWWKNLCYPHSLKFRGHKIRVKKAPEPSTIMWENLETSNAERNKRKALTSFVAFLAIFISVVFTFHARDIQQTAMDEGGTSECPADWSSRSDIEKLEVSERAFWKTRERATKLTLYHFILLFCSAQHATSTDDIHCYCNENALASICKEYVKSQALAKSVTIGASIAVIIINMFFTWLMNKAAKFERHQSLDSMEASILSRTFLLKFVNTGCLILLYNQRIIQNMVGVQLDIDADFSKSWYSTAGSSVFLIMIGTIISPHLAPLYRYWSEKKARIRAIEGSKVSERSERALGLHPQTKLTKSAQDKLKAGDDHAIEWFTQDCLNSVFLGERAKRASLVIEKYQTLCERNYYSWLHPL